MTSDGEEGRSQITHLITDVSQGDELIRNDYIDIRKK